MSFSSNDSNTNHNKERKYLNKHAQTFDHSMQFISMNIIYLFLHRDGGDSKNGANDNQ